MKKEYCVVLLNGNPPQLCGSVNPITLIEAKEMANQMNEDYGHIKVFEHGTVYSVIYWKDYKRIMWEEMWGE